MMLVSHTKYIANPFLIIRRNASIISIDSAWGIVRGFCTNINDAVVLSAYTDRLCHCLLSTSLYTHTRVARGERPYACFSLKQICAHPFIPVNTVRRFLCLSSIRVAVSFISLLSAFWLHSRESFDDLSVELLSRVTSIHSLRFRRLSNS